MVVDNSNRRGMAMSMTATKPTLKMPEQRRLHVCDGCGKEFVWDENSIWFGSLATEDCGHVLKMCSDGCRDSIGNPSAFFEKKFGRPIESRFYRFP